MFSLFNRSPIKKLNKQHTQLLEQAMQAQRNGDIKTYSKLSEQADKVLKEIDAIATD